MELKKKREKRRVVVRRTRLGFYVPFEAHLPSQPLIGVFNCAVRSQRQGATVLLVFKMTCDKASFVREYRLRDVQERRLMDVQERRLRDVVRTRESCCGRRTPAAFGTLHWPCVTVRFLSDLDPPSTSFDSGAASGTVRRRKNSQSSVLHGRSAPFVYVRHAVDVVPACVDFQHRDSVTRGFNQIASSKKVYRTA